MPELQMPAPCDVPGQQHKKSAHQVEQNPEIRSISTPPRNGTKRPGMVITMTCQLTLTVECVAARMYQLTPAKFMPLPNSDTNMATKKYRNPRCAQISVQSTRCVVAVAMKPLSLLLCRNQCGRMP